VSGAVCVQRLTPSLCFGDLAASTSCTLLVPSQQQSTCTADV
jgi:hypothetical protein